MNLHCASSTRDALSSLYISQSHNRVAFQTPTFEKEILILNSLRLYAMRHEDYTLDAVDSWLRSWTLVKTLVLSLTYRFTSSIKSLYSRGSNAIKSAEQYGLVPPAFAGYFGEKMSKESTNDN
jgi:hypothetical protein